MLCGAEKFGIIFKVCIGLRFREFCECDGCSVGQKWLMLLLSLILLPTYLIAEPLLHKTESDSVLPLVMQRLYDGIASGKYSVESLYADLYIKETVDSERKNLLLNIIPDMTRFDRLNT